MVQRAFASRNTLLRLVVTAHVYRVFSEAAGGCVGANGVFIANHGRVQRGERRRGTGRNCDGDEEELQQGWFRHVEPL